MADVREEQDRSDEELVEACLRGEAPAWESLVRRYAGLVYSVPLRYQLSRDDAADIFQNTWSSLWEQLAEVRDRKRLAAWLVTVAARLSYQQLERLQRQRALLESDSQLASAPDRDPQSMPEELLAARDEAASVRTAMAQLPERCRQLLYYLFYDPTAPSYSAIAQRLGLSPDSLGSMRRRCLRQLRDLLEGDDYLPRF